MERMLRNFHRKEIVQPNDYFGVVEEDMNDWIWNYRDLGLAFGR